MQLQGIYLEFVQPSFIAVLSVPESWIRVHCWAIQIGLFSSSWPSRAERFHWWGTMWVVTDYFYFLRQCCSIFWCNPHFISASESVFDLLDINAGESQVIVIFLPAMTPRISDGFTAIDDVGRHTSDALVNPREDISFLSACGLSWPQNWLSW